MKVSYNNLQKFFDGKLPSADAVAEALTFHAWEIEEVVGKDGDFVIDVKVLPDKSAWALSHRGIARDLSAVLNIPLAKDPLRTRPDLVPKTDAVSVNIATEKCDRYIVAYVTGVKIQPSPQWLQDELRVLGQRSINNIVDITNYVMLGVGQPLHAFDAKKLSSLAIGVRLARAGEKITSLTGDEYTLSTEDAVVVDGGNDMPVGIAGVKGGKRAEIDETTTDILIESAHFDAVSVRKTSQRLKLRTDASMRYENGVVSDMTAYAIRDAVKFITEFVPDFGGGTLQGYVDTGSASSVRTPVSVSLAKINSVLGLELTREEVAGIIARFGWEHAWDSDTLTVQPPFERPDLTIPEDLIEEVGRIYGYEHVESVIPEKVTSAEINATFYYTDLIRTTLADVGFSEVFTSSFRAMDDVQLKNAFASDKGYLRSALSKNMEEALARNAPNADLLGVREVRMFEVGTVFTKEGQHLALALGVSSPSGYKAKNDDKVLALGIEAVERALGVSLSWSCAGGIAEAALSETFAKLPAPSAYTPFTKTPDITYKSFSNYPFASRDVAFWVTQSPENQILHEAENLILRSAGPLLVRLDLFDQFEKESRTSLAFRLVFQSYEKTLTEEEINGAMESVYAALKEAGCEIR